MGLHVGFATVPLDVDRSRVFARPVGLAHEEGRSDDRR
jgi:hypothetical protein